ncbi:hypothetical protein M1408_03790 [Candidatus Marsarchaeota archaeon]|jgi:hypothetical protein|nr:hypothetical protein [Candidatus Marsarchaeota archaeon]
MKSQLSFVGLVAGIAILAPVVVGVSLLIYGGSQSPSATLPEMYDSFYDLSSMAHGNASSQACLESEACIGTIGRNFADSYGLRYIRISSPYASTSYGNRSLCTYSYYNCMTYYGGSLLCVYECE